MALKILVADDATFIRDMIKKQLRDRIPGVELYDAADGARALALFRQNPIDLVLSDWEMPQMTGEEFLRHVRASGDSAKTPFIMITSRGDRDHVVKAVQSGVSDYITKPFTPDELIRKVHKQLRHIGKVPSASARPAAAQGFAASTVDVLTGSMRPDLKAAAPAKPAASASAALLTGNSAALLTGQPASKPTAVPASKKAQAQLRFPGGRTFACVIREMSLQLLSCSMARADQLPQVFEQVVVDVDMGEDKGLARVNGYVHSVAAGENNANSNHVKLIIRFVDNDVDKFEVLSKYIAQM